MQKVSKRNGMTGCAILLALLLGGNSAWAATEPSWAWMGGAEDALPAVHGTLGGSAAGNIPGARYDTCCWTDSAGNAWVFGGYGFDSQDNRGVLNDLWKRDASSGQWTWMKGSQDFNASGTYGTQGVAAATNTPGARTQAVSWVDAAGALWLFGGYGYDGVGGAGYLNDLWKYTPTTGNWTWMKGASTINQTDTYGTLGTPAEANTPGACTDSVSWTDATGGLWLFGGYANDALGGSVYYGDLWKYTPATGNWTWMKGSGTPNQAGVYGAQGVPAADNMPGGRWGAVSWTDASGALWLFGGAGYSRRFNDLWKYTPSTGNWTWMKGASSGLPSGVYGTLGVPADANTPGARFWAASWTDASGALWLFGGNGSDGAGSIDRLNDVWRYSPSTGNWTWMKGSNTVLQPGTYGTLGTPAPSNTPGARDAATAWTDASGAVWLFGGCVYYSNGMAFENNDLWRLDVPDTTPPTGTITINGNRSTTNSRTVTIALTWSDGTNGSGVARMRFSDDGSTWSAYESLTASKSYTLPVGDDGYRTVRVQFIDKANNRSATCSDYIRLDRSVPTGGIVINDGASTTTTQAVTLKLNWADTGSGVARMRFSDNGSTWTSWLYPTATRAHTLPAGLGYHTVRVQYLDGANNYSPVYNDYIKLVAP